MDRRHPLLRSVLVLAVLSASAQPAKAEDELFPESARLVAETENQYMGASCHWSDWDPKTKKIECQFTMTQFSRAAPPAEVSFEAEWKASKTKLWKELTNYKAEMCNSNWISTLEASSSLAATGNAPPERKSARQSSKAEIEGLKRFASRICAPCKGNEACGREFYEALNELNKTQRRVCSISTYSFTAKFINTGTARWSPAIEPTLDLCNIETSVTLERSFDAKGQVFWTYTQQRRFKDGSPKKKECEGISVVPFTFISRDYDDAVDVTACDKVSFSILP